MKSRFFTLFLLISPNYCFCQEPSSQSHQLPHNSVNIELLGNSFLIGSINYEKIFHLKNGHYLSGRIGVGYDYYQEINILSTPILINYIYNIHKDISIELGLGTDIVIQFENNSNENELIPLFTGVIGVRIQSPTGFIFKAGITPFINFGEKHPIRISTFFMPWVGISFGYSFR